MEGVLFDQDKPAPEPMSFELDSAYQGQEALEMVKQCAGRTAALRPGLCGRADAARLGWH